MNPSCVPMPHGLDYTLKKTFVKTFGTHAFDHNWSQYVFKLVQMCLSVKNVQTVSWKTFVWSLLLEWPWSVWVVVEHINVVALYSVVHGNAFRISEPIVRNPQMDSPHKGPVMRSSDMCIVVRLNKLCNKKSRWLWFETYTMDCLSKKILSYQ